MIDFGFQEVNDLEVVLVVGTNSVPWINIECKDVETADKIAEVLTHNQIKFHRVSYTPTELEFVKRYGYDADHLAEKMALKFQESGYKVKRLVSLPRTEKNVECESFLTLNLS
jgi:hypothetical protein